MLNQITILSMEENKFENVICKMATICLSMLSDCSTQTYKAHDCMKDKLYITQNSYTTIG